MLVCVRKSTLAVAVIVAVVSVVSAQPAATVYYLNPAWSPDGRTIIFESTPDGRFAIFAIGQDGSGLKKLSSTPAADEQARWSPDGRRIVFISDEGGFSRLYLMNADGSGRRQLTNAEEYAFLPEFSPNGRKVVFQSSPDRQGMHPDIYTIGTDGKQRRKLTDGLAEYTAPRWSPNGKWIMYNRAEFIPAEVMANFPRMSRDERRMAIKAKNDSSEIYVVRPNGSGTRNVTANKVSDDNVRWSRDGKMIYFRSSRDGPELTAYSMRPDGSNVRRVDDREATGSSVSPDGRSLVYGKEVNGKWGIYVYDLSSRTERFIVGDR